MNIRDNGKSRINTLQVIPAEAGIQKFQSIAKTLDTGLHRCDDLCNYLILKENCRLRISVVVTLALLALALIIPARLWSYELEKKVKKFTLDNGLKVLLLERHASPTVSLYIRHQVGAVDEANGLTGTAHLLEHLMFKGTETIGTKNYQAEKKILRQINQIGSRLDQEKMNGEQADKKLLEELKIKLSELQKKHRTMILSNEIDRLYTENGAVGLNASTGQDVTTYQVSLPANKIELWARIEADRMQNPVFREFYAERDVVMEERRQSVESDPEGKLMEQFHAAAFQAHPYGRPVLGWPSDMSFLNPDYTRDFFNRYHAPNNTVIAIVGDIDAGATLRIVKKYFGGIRRQKMSVVHISDEPPQRGERRVEVSFSARPQLIIGYHKPTLPSYDDYVFDVIESILSQGRTSRLYKSIVEKKGLAESVQAANGWPGVRYPNLFALFATPRDSHACAELESAIYEEIERLKTEEVSSQEIEKTKNQLKADFIRGLASNSGLASKLSYYEMLAGDYRYLVNHVDFIEKITPADIIRVANTYLTKENRTVATLINNQAQLTKGAP
jgi:predicted Zn-dependent peptidase